MLGLLDRAIVTTVRRACGRYSFLLSETITIVQVFKMVDSISMRKIFITIFSIVVFLPLFIWSQNSQEQDVANEAKIKKLYRLPDNLPSPDDAHILQNILAGTESGLYKIIGNDTPEPLWNESRVTQIIETFVSRRSLQFYRGQQSLS